MVGRGRMKKGRGCYTPNSGWRSRPRQDTSVAAGLTRYRARGIAEIWEEGMRFGFFDQLPCAPGYSEPQRYKDILAQIELGDAVGFDTVWLGEIHFIREFSILADPLMVLAAAAQRTSRIRLGTAVTLLPLHNPIKIAEEAAIADILSDGRLEFGGGRGIARHYPSYGIPPQARRARFDEALDFILAASTNDSFSFYAKYFP